MRTKAFDWSETTQSGSCDEEIPQRVTALELAAIKRLRERVANMRAELADLAMTLQQREDDVIDRLENGSLCEGVATVMVRRRQNISWLTVVVRELGAEAVENTKNTWPITFWKELQLA